MSMQVSVLLASLLVAACSYLLGSVSWSVIVSKLLYHKDVREFGSGNAGMTNILRTFGKGPAVLVTIGDFSKSIITVFVSRLIFDRIFGPLPFDIGFVAGIFTILGHLFPVYFGFKGGKGVLTALGMILVLNPLVFLVVAVIFIPMVFIIRIVSAVAVLGAICYPLITYAVLTLSEKPARVDTVFACVIAFIVLYMHRTNIKRLLNGTEFRFGKPKDKK